MSVDLESFAAVFQMERRMSRQSMCFNHGLQVSQMIKVFTHVCSQHLRLINDKHDMPTEHMFPSFAMSSKDERYWPVHYLMLSF